MLAPAAGRVLKVPVSVGSVVLAGLLLKTGSYGLIRFGYPLFPQAAQSLTPLLYALLFLHAVILMVGGHYTYARVPIGFWVQDAFELARNHYDRVGHLAQGFVPAILAREILLRPIGHTVYFMPPYVIGDDDIALMVTAAREGLDRAVAD